MNMRKNKRNSTRKIRFLIVILLSLCIFEAFLLVVFTQNTPVYTSPEPSIIVVTTNPTPTSTPLATESPSQTPKIEENPRYGFTQDDIYLLAQLLCGDKTVDGDGEYDIDFAEDVNYYETGKVLAVVMNRVRSNEYPNSVYDVVRQTGQFAVMPRNLEREPSDKALELVQEWCDLYDDYDESTQYVPEDHLYFTGNGTSNITRATWR